LTWLDLPRVVGGRACVRRRCLNHVETIHLATVFSQLSPRDEFARVTQITGKRRRQKVAIERQDPLREIEAISRVYRLAESCYCTCARIVAISGFILVPLSLRKRGERRFHLRPERWRNDRFSEKTNARTLLRTLLVKRRTHLTDKRSPRADIFAIRQRL